MKYLKLSILFLFITGCSESEPSTELPKEQFSLPNVTTTAITDITEVSASSGGNVTNDGGATVTARGVCWSTSSNPTISDNKTTNAQGTGEFDSSITGLESNSTYYVRAYATNSEGTGYGNEINFSTLEPEPEAKIYDGDVILNSQNDIDEFGEQGYSEITGSLLIKDENFPHIENLNALGDLAVIGGDLSIIEINNIEFKTLNGLNSIVSVGGTLLISTNFWLENLEALNNLEDVKSLEIFNTGTLFFLTGLEKIEELDNLKISHNGQLRNLEGLSQLKLVENEVIIESNQGIENLNGLRNLSELKSLVVGYNERLIDLTGLEKIERLENLEISSNTELINLDGLSQLFSVETNVFIEGNREMLNLNGLSKLKSVGDRVRITFNLALDDFCGLTMLVENNGIPEEYTVENNSYNPTQQDILDGNCSQ